MRASKIFVCITIFAIVSAMIVQSMTSLNEDVSWGLYIASLLAKGGRYYFNFVETNPPLYLYLYLPVIFIAKIGHLSQEIVFRFYMICLSLVSIICCYHVLKKFADENFYIKYIFLYSLLFVFFFLPARDFGQREHIFLILTLPYFITVALTAKSQKNSFFMAILIGLMGGLGFALKPFFIAPLVLVEFYLIVKHKTVFGWFRVESMICATVLFAYIGFVYLFHHEYFTSILPLVSKWYFVGHRESIQTFLFKYTVLFCFFVLIYYFLFYSQKYPRNELLTVFVLTLIGMIIAFTIPMASWYYHVLPAMAVSCILILLFIAHMFSADLKDKKFSKFDIGILIVAIANIFAGIFFHIYFYLNISWNSHQTGLQELTNYINMLSRKEKSIYCLSSWTTGTCFPLIQNTQSYFAGRYAILWWLRGMETVSKAPFSPLKATLENDKKYFNEEITRDLKTYHPEIIIINTKNESYINDDLTIMSYLLANPEFTAVWKTYHYLGKIDRFKIYQRSI